MGNFIISELKRLTTFHRRGLCRRGFRWQFMVWYLLLVLTISSIYIWRSSVDFPGLADYPILNRKTQQATADDTDVTPVIIVGYMRSGSSMTADFIQQNPDVFYLLEPLHDAESEYLRTMQADFAGLPFRGRRVTSNYKDEMLNILRAWFTCDLQFIMAKQSRSFAPFFHFSKKTRKFSQCLEGSTDIRQKYSKRCTSLLQKLCLDSKHRLVKTIRIGLKWLPELLTEFSNLRVIHLVRDPRAIIESQMRYGQCDVNHNGVPGCSNNLCSNMEDDLHSFEILKQLFPERVYRLHYEDIAQNPVPVTKQVYKYLGLRLDSIVEKYIIYATSAGNTQPWGSLSTIRANSSLSIHRWRRNLNDKNLRTVQVMCRYVMEKLSYQHFIKP